MTRTVRGFALLLAVLATSSAEALGTPAAPNWTVELNSLVQEAIQGFDGELSLYVLDVASGEEYAYDAERPTYLSSAIKLGVMLEVMHQVDQQQLSWEETLEFTPSTVRDGMHRLHRARPGDVLAISTLLEDMMVDSDNAAADLLIQRVGVDNVKAQLASRGVRTGPVSSLLDERRRIYAKLDPKAQNLSPAQVRALGKHDSLESRAQFLSKVMTPATAWTGKQLDQAFQAFYAENVNSASMRDMGHLLQQVVRCEGLSASSCTRAHALMRACQTGSARISAGLPETAAWAHKTGTQHRRACDMGFVSLPSGRTAVIAACTRNFWHVADAERLFAFLGASIWRTLSAPAAQVSRSAE
ncbi:class A beta-lactamase-related serine hydrolase [Stigmatella sp. ncwal1]|uniref:beta-lactamase n=1 Tax=Stigmatella ashevillensis TaxID=2995309 RepID=A0ABT5DF75_9BACT|nr:serine hydrolase [Stigmatella ashevillena]MDC0710972.1 class A beta-lactamase-related serine hydrolase [Stigmatella ashevillena]